MRLLAIENPTADFSQDNGWVIVGKALFIFVFLLVLTILTVWSERRVVARMQSRPGPNRVGPFGLLQTVADGVKLILKEDIIPKKVDRAVFILAPVISGTTCFLAFSVIPFGPSARIPFTKITTPLQLTDLPVAVLLVLAVAAVGVYGIVLAGWSSGSTYPLLGSLRSSAQVISYEIAMGLALISVFLYAGSMSTSSIVAAQSKIWFAVQLPVAFIIYCIAMVGETNRAPFDLPEADAELVGGYHTEYSGTKFMLFFLAEYINLITVSAIATTLFLGGWHAPFMLDRVWAGANQGWWPLLWFVLKLMAFIFLFIWLRGSLPRLRYDQFMRFGWKGLIPAGLLWIVAVSFIRTLRTQPVTSVQKGLLIAGILVIIVVAVSAYWSASTKEFEATAARKIVITPELDPYEGGYPVPPMPGQTLRRATGPLLTAAIAVNRRSESIVAKDDEEVSGG